MFSKTLPSLYVCVCDESVYQAFRITDNNVLPFGLGFAPGDSFHAALAASKRNKGKEQKSNEPDDASEGLRHQQSITKDIHLGLSSCQGRMSRCADH